MSTLRTAGGRQRMMVLDQQPVGFEDILGFGQRKGDRAYQEDDMRIAYSGRDTDTLMILADGMGGHRGGAVASRLAVETFAKTFGTAEGSVEARLRASLDAANAAVGRRADNDGDCWEWDARSLPVCGDPRRDRSLDQRWGLPVVAAARSGGRRPSDHTAPERRSFDEAGTRGVGERRPHRARGGGEGGSPTSVGSNGRRPGEGG